MVYASLACSPRGGIRNASTAGVPAVWTSVHDRPPAPCIGRGRRPDVFGSEKFPFRWRPDGHRRELARKKTAIQWHYANKRDFQKLLRSERNRNLFRLSAAHAVPDWLTMGRALFIRCYGQFRCTSCSAVVHCSVCTVYVYVRAYAQVRLRKCDAYVITGVRWTSRRTTHCARRVRKCAV